SIAEWRAMLQPDGPAGQQATRVARKPGPLARVATRTGRARITLRGRALWGVAAAMVLLVAGGGYLAFQAGGAGAGAAYNLTAEQLEQALAERRKADALAAEKKRLVEKAQRKADADAEAKRQADSDLEQARQARQKAEQELAQVKAEIEARRQQDTGQRDQ